jgi:hypothetical protein
MNYKSPKIRKKNPGKKNQKKSLNEYLIGKSPKRNPGKNNGTPTVGKSPKKLNSTPL